MKQLFKKRICFAYKLFFLLILFFQVVGCQKPTEPIITDPPHVTANTMKIEYLWADFERIALGLKKSRLDSSNTFTYELHRQEENGESWVIYKGGLHSDTSITDSGGLSKEKSYQYRFSGYSASTKILDTAISITAKVLNSTGHNFVWEVDTLGEPGNAGILDLWGLDENNVWGIGGVLLPEGSTGFMKWDGNKWNRIPGIPELIKNGIFGFSSQEIWVVGNGNYNWGGAFFYNGTSFTEYNFDADKPEYSDTIYALNAVWGSAPNDVWAVGLGGTIIHWDGQVWKKVPGINRRYIFYEITGRSSDEIYTVGVDPSNGEWVLYIFNGNIWRTMQLGYSYMPRVGVWQAKSGQLYLLGSTSYVLKNGTLEYLPMQNAWVQSSIRGSGVNNIFSVGHAAEIIHYDGSTWKKLESLPNRVGVTILTKPFVTDTHFFVGSITDYKPLIIRGRIQHTKK